MVCLSQWSCGLKDEALHSTRQNLSERLLFYFWHCINSQLSVGLGGRNEKQNRIPRIGELKPTNLPRTGSNSFWNKSFWSDCSFFPDRWCRLQRNTYYTGIKKIITLSTKQAGWWTKCYTSISNHCPLWRLDLSSNSFLPGILWSLYLNIISSPDKWLIDPLTLCFYSTAMTDSSSENRIEYSETSSGKAIDLYLSDQQLTNGNLRVNVENFTV